jgi:hypothetical protein
LALKGKTAVILATDGAPNCNGNALCDMSTCIANIEGAFRANGKRCDSTVNCCSPTADYGPYACIDEDASAAPIETLLSHGIKTYVVGLPGTDAYTGVLNRLAAAGGTARSQALETDPQYYRVEDSAALATALKSIVTSVSISCTLKLDAVPPDWSKVNVYFDNALVRMSETDGWRQVDARQLELVGESCKLLSSGDVFQVQVVAGCETQTMQ